MNMFLGKTLIHGGVYPDGVIRLVKKGKSQFPQKSVHEQIKLDGEVGWLTENLLHYDSPTMKRYLDRLNRYTDLFAKEYSEEKLPKNVWNFMSYVIFKPISTFFSLFIRHKGILDGAPGFIWSFFSASRFAISYFKYLTSNS
ncbi:MAG: hypothetical protein GYA60_07005 [Candidatus Methanofastidiosa archaeon]|nr:hypothetical protein [Candidatus Methanofastidiosa archaeon]